MGSAAKWRQERLGIACACHQFNESMRASLRAIRLRINPDPGRRLLHGVQAAECCSPVPESPSGEEGSCACPHDERQLIWTVCVGS